MNSILEFVQSKVQYRVSLIDCKDSEGLPLNVTISVDKSDAKSFEEYLKNEEGNVFAHAEGGNIEY